MKESVLSFLMLSVPYISLHFHRRITYLMHVPLQVLSFVLQLSLAHASCNNSDEPCFWFVSISLHNTC